MNLLSLLFIFLSSFIILYLLMPFYIRHLISLNYNQEVSEYALDEYKQKRKTPIMGGLLFVLIPIIILTILHFDFFNDSRYLIVILSYILFCLVGFLDDFLIIIRKDNKGLSPRKKLLLQLFFTFLIYFIFYKDLNKSIAIPFINYNLDLGHFYLLFMLLMYSSEANAVNFTDGMDGLCAGVSFISLIPFLIFAYLEKIYPLVYLIIAILGSLLAYLKYNYHPAKIFMGDSGSIALGGLFASLAMVLNKEIALIFVGGVFVWEMLCVVIQIGAVKLFHRRVFSYTPIHYAFQLKGMRETRIVKSFYLIAFILALLGLIIGVLG